MNHEQLWAPWRLAYIAGAQEAEKPLLAEVPAGGDPACFLCRATIGSDDRDRLVVERGQCSLTVLNLYPYNNGHLLVAPLRHVARLDQLEAAEQLDLVQTIARMIGLLERTIRAEGFNVGLNLGQVAGRDCQGTSTGTSCRAGTAIPTSCPPWLESASFRNRWMRFGNC